MFYVMVYNILIKDYRIIPLNLSNLFGVLPHLCRAFYSFFHHSWLPDDLIFLFSFSEEDLFIQLENKMKKMEE